MDRQLPPLPEPDSYCTHKDDHEYDVWNADQMRAYAEEAVKQERERCAGLCEDYAIKATFDGDPEDDHEGAAYLLAAAIRARGESNG